MRKPLLVTPAAITAAILTLALSTACGGGSAASPNSSSAAQPSSSTTSGSVSAGKAVDIHVSLTGGPTAGAWDVSGDQPCDFVHDQNGTQWGVTFNNPDQNTTQLAIFSVGYFADGANANKFTVQAQVGSSSNPTYVATTLAQTDTLGGSGTVSVQDGGTTAKYMVDVQTKEGYSIKATVQCNKVTRIGS